MYCTHCGKDLRQKSKYCCNCGKKTEYEGAIYKLKENVHKKTAYYLDLLRLKIQRTEMTYFKKYGLYLGAALLTSVALFVINLSVLPYYKNRQYGKGKSMFENEAYEEAVQVFRQAAGLRERDQEIYKYMGQAYLNLDDYENARESLSKSLDLSEDYRDIEVFILLSEVYFYEGDMKSYESILIQMTEAFPNHSYAYLQLGYYYKDNKHFDRAAKVLEELLSRENNDEATKLLYNVYLQSYTDNKAAEKVNSIKTGAYRIFSSNPVFEQLDIEGGVCISVSPSGDYMITQTGAHNRRVFNIYSRRENYYEIMDSFSLPVLYRLEGSQINWSPDETKFTFYNAAAQEYQMSSYIYMYDLAAKTLYNLTEPKGYVDYGDLYGSFLLDSIPAFSEDGQRIYFARHSSDGNGLFSIDIQTGEIRQLYEPSNGARVMYNIIERNNNVYFSVAGIENTTESGLYKYRDGQSEKLIFDYDDKFYFLALNDISADGRYLMYYITTASQNNSFYFKILDLETMRIVNIYDQVIDYVEKEFTSVCRMDIFGERYAFICKNAVFSKDGKSIVLAEQAKGFAGKLLRTINIETGNSSFVYLSFDESNMDQFSLNLGAGGNGESTLRQIDENSYLIYDQGLQILHE